MFDDVNKDASAVVVVLTSKSATQIRSTEEVIGYAVVSLESYVKICLEAGKTQREGNPDGRTASILREVTISHKLLDKQWNHTPGSVSLALLMQRKEA